MASATRALAAGFLLLAACLPIHERFLRANAPGAEYHGVVCGGVTGPPERMVVRGPEGVLLGVDVHRLGSTGGAPPAGVAGAPPPGSLGVTLVLHVPEGRTVELGPEPFVLLDQASYMVFEARPAAAVDIDANILIAVVADVERFSSDPKARVTALPAALPGTGRRRWHVRPTWFGQQLDHPYYIPVVFAGARTDRARLRLPPLRVDRGAPFAFPELEIRFVEKWWIAPMNC